MFGFESISYERECEIPQMCRMPKLHGNIVRVVNWKHQRGQLLTIM